MKFFFVGGWNFENSHPIEGITLGGQTPKMLPTQKKHTVLKNILPVLINFP